MPGQLRYVLRLLADTLREVKHGEADNILCGAHGDNSEVSFFGEMWLENGFGIDCGGGDATSSASCCTRVEFNASIFSRPFETLSLGKISSSTSARVMQSAAGAITPDTPLKVAASEESTSVTLSLTREEGLTCCCVVAVLADRLADARTSQARVGERPRRGACL